MEDEGVVSGVSWLGDEGVSGVRRVGEGVGLGIARVGDGDGCESREGGWDLFTFVGGRQGMVERRYMLVVLGEFVDSSQRTFWGVS